jgi:hypothetical protein
MPYGSAAGVAALASLWTLDGEWVDPNDAYSIRGTNPSLTTVESWLDTLSAQMDTCLQTNWFNVPIEQATSPTSYDAVSQYINELASNLARKANGAATVETSPGKTLQDMCKWVETNADSFIKDGVTQTPQVSKKNQAKIRVIGTLP